MLFRDNSCYSRRESPSITRSFLRRSLEGVWSVTPPGTWLLIKLPVRNHIPHLLRFRIIYELPELDSQVTARWIPSNPFRPLLKRGVKIWSVHRVFDV